MVAFPVGSGVPSHIYANSVAKNMVTNGFAAGRTAALTTAAAAAWYPLLTLRPQATALGTNIRLSRIRVTSDDVTDFIVRLWLAPTVGGVDAADFTGNQLGGLEYDVTRDNTNVLSAGEVKDEWYAAGGGTINDFFPYYQQWKLGAVANELVVAVYNTSGLAEGFTASLSWLEE